MFFSESDIEQLPKLKRVNLINSLTGFKSANLIGTVNNIGETNLSIISSVVHLGSHPPLIGYIQRPRAVARHTYENIVYRKKYTINAIRQDFIEQAHQTSARYPRNVSEFTETNISVQWLKNFEAPFVKESPIKIGLELQNIIPIPDNNTELVIGKIVQLYIPEEVLMPDGHLEIYNSGVVAIAGLDTYLKTEKIARYSYAKPGKKLTEI